MLPNLATSYLGMALKNPLVASSCPLTGDLDALAALADAGIGAVVLPSLFEEQMSQAPSCTLLESIAFPRVHTATLSNVADVHRHNIGPAEYMRLIEAAKARLPIPVIASLNGCTPGGWTQCAQMLQSAGADALELNIYIVPTSPNLTAFDIEEQYLDLLTDIRNAISIPLAVKIGAQISSLPHFVQQLVQTGADGVVLFNRYLEPDIDLKTLQFTPQITLSHSHELRLPLRWIGILRDQTSASLGASGGVHSASDAIKLLLAGADVVMVASALLKRGEECVADILTELKQWLHDHGFESVAQARGSLSYGRSVDSGNLERSYYMRAVASYSAVH